MQKITWNRSLRRFSIKKCISMFMIAAMSLTLFGCASADTDLVLVNKGMNAKIEKKVAAKKKIVEKQTDTTKGMNEFAFHLMGKLPKENQFYSPYSISVAMSMLDNAAGGNTKTELENVLGIKDLGGRNQNIKDIMGSFQGTGAVLNTANSIWWRKNMMNFSKNMESDFLQPLSYYYNADVYKVNFAKKATVNQINNWISKRTKKMIPKMLDELDADTAMCLINAVYFEGKWKYEFEHENTYTQEFYGADQATSVDMMHASNWNLRYFADDAIRGIELPYKDSNIVMQIFMSSDDKPIWNKFTKMSTKKQLKYITKLSKSEEKNITSLALPKYKMDYKIDQLPAIMESMGIVDAFDPSKANFDKINDSMYVSDILHQARIEVDEKGSKAAAATIIMTKDSCMRDPEAAIHFIVDHPFIYTIKDTSTGAILFMGYMNQM